MAHGSCTPATGSPNDVGKEAKPNEILGKFRLSLIDLCEPDGRRHGQLQPGFHLFETRAVSFELIVSLV